ncbi:tRNA 2-selenouridine(34) synthase MnmH [Pigmentiphaga sp.]|uniref:tRNA 2-selenouridine(34) synthase MnmH n=1 Tax=Pigmentiphaga sp. TaxID=1977564 RepID=UPI0025D9AEC0|nr:tRNA 2-selenouridine(34) synthase MnmH [Pigmentiphaga sp.]MBX6319802.1 tRNA 2-selenouridine(34) synthase MnmH [Pigmentiphaga sp.]
MRGEIDDYRSLFLRGVPMIDTRAPVEFAKGAFPGAVNLPLMSDAEREQVGTCYKQKGQEAAIALGHRLVQGAIKAQRIEAWASFARAHSDGCLYCFRGGLRSQIAQQWLREEAGIEYPRVVGGYKAMRAFLLQAIEDAAHQCGFLVLGGMTGTGKTELVRQVENGLDLEAYANHRGSSFGKRATAQPPQIGFENSLAIDLLKKRDAGTACLVVEDESHAIGSCSIPFALYQRMQSQPLVWLEDALESRVERILKDYVVDLRAEFAAVHGEEEGERRFGERLRGSLDNIARRLGGDRHRRVAALMDAALAEQARSGSVEFHRDWIRALLLEYYDPMYDYQRRLKGSRIVFAGDRRAVLEYLRAQSSA